MINNRQAGRRRGRGGQQQRSSGGGGNPGRQDTGNRIDNRARGNAAQLLEKYKTLARDAQMQGDRVNVEYYLQFADHYFRVLAETRARFEENGGAVSTKRIQGATLDEDEPDYEDEGERVLEQPRGEQPRGEQPRGDQQREQNRGDQQRGGQNGYRQDGNRQDGNRQDGNRGYSQNGQSNHAAANGQGGAESRDDAQGYEDRPRGRVNGNAEGGDYRQADASREDRTERQPARAERYERPERPDRSPRTAEPADEAQPVAEALSFEAAAPVEPVAEAPRRGRGRPRRDAAPVVEAAAVPDAPASDEAAFEDNGFAADRLPPALNISAVAEPELGHEGEVVEKPRRRRGRPPANAATTVE
ncbi:DUF4167 domain-containing protein [Sphingomonas sp. PAMC 26605]|uniref:DUF4167 domain-containing protein n=1 Tax=Sphingomonas sp. PAMC 26605 TaxID=1112214 RepID=UPI00026CCAAF|nr:DUF4167 domain-containing protein [Sphingomonas sp. PAMC 26605]